jgi:hypothetical protein
MKYPDHKMSCKIPVEEWILPTAEQFYQDFDKSSIPRFDDIYEAMCEFAKMHVEAALKAASEEALTECDEGGETGFVNQQSILTAYPSELIK